MPTKSTNVIGQARALSGPYSTFPSTDANNGGTSTSALAFTRVAGSTTDADAFRLDIPSNGKIASGDQFKVVASGRIVGGASAVTGTLTLRWGNPVSATPGNNTTIKASSAKTITAASYGWTMEGVFVWDSVSQKVSGYTTFNIGGISALDAPVVTTTMTSVDLTDATQTYGMTLDVTFGTNGQAGNKAFLESFSLEAI